MAIGEVLPDIGIRVYQPVSEMFERAASIKTNLVVHIALRHFSTKTRQTRS